MALGIRGSNPIWAEFDLSGKIFDDTYYMFVLENTIPYIPATVWHDPDFNTVWTNPIQFLGNGTLPVDIYFEAGTVYRLEFRKGPTQSDPLIYEVNNYIAGEGGSTPVDTVAFASSNQITNPQFALTSFASPLSLVSVTNPDPIEIAPGWFLELAGTGSATITKVPLNNANENPSNAPYALRLTLSGWSANSVFLRQRFQQNGMLWANKYVSSTLTARIEGSPQPVSAQLIDSNNSVLAEVLTVPAVNSTFNEYKGNGLLLATTNPDVPPAAYIDYKLALPTNVDIYLTSIQLVVGELAIEPSFEQDSIDRQIDHTFHYYRDSLLTQPKESLLTGWDFGLNPWQFTTPVSTTLAAQCAYTADQTIVYQQAGGSEVAVGRGTAAENYAFEVRAIGNNSRFAIIQYIDPTTVRDVWQYVLSSLVRAYISTPTHASAIRFKMRLIYRSSLPSTIGAAEPISTWAGATDPTFAAGWTAITPKNDPIYTFGARGQTFNFEGMQLPASNNANMTLGIVLYTLDPIIETATADRILFERISLCRNDFAIDGQILSFDETLRRCQFYWETSKNTGVLPSATTVDGALLALMKFAPTTGTISMFANSFGFQFKVPKRTLSSVTRLYTPAGTIDQVTGYMFNGTTNVGSTSFSDTAWTASNVGNNGIQYLVNTNSALYDGAIAASVGNTTHSYILYHFQNDARMGI